MRIVSFKTPKPKSFSYRPRYYDPEKEVIERRKAAMGLDSNLTQSDKLRLQMQRRWRKNNDEVGSSTRSRMVSYTIYGAIILGSIYFIMFTDIIEKFLKAFGVTH